MRHKCNKCGSIGDSRICPQCIEDNTIILVSFSGGRTSAYMAKVLLDIYPRNQLIFVFANTGQEHEKTLEFVDKVDKAFNLGVVWVEAVVNMKKNVATTHRIVDFNSACRDTRLFADMAMKFGLPGPGWLHCTRELKERPIHSYVTTVLKKKKWKGYKTAIGIRADEIDRIRPDFAKKNIIYPLADEGITKPDVLAYWSKQDFDLEIPDYLGNCTWCWKKSANKLRKIASEHRGLMEPAINLEKYANHGAGDEPRKMYRGRLTASEILADVNKIERDPENYENSCAESCEPFQGAKGDE